MQLERRLGTVLCGKWTLEQVLGSGGMAAVYVGVHTIGRRDAIKILHPEIARDPELCARFRQEAHAVNRFVHPGAVEIRDVDVTDDGCPFLVMELLEGESLADRCKRAGVPEIDEVLRIADELLDVLSAAHAQGIVHRDIKPGNLFCLPDGRIKVLDFGVARVRAASAVRTRVGTTLGTLAYMSPEQVNGADIDARADIFSVGATMFRLIAKRRIHEASSDTDLVVKMSKLPAPPLGSVAPDAPAGVCAIVDRALAFDRERRYPSAAAMQRDVVAQREGRPLSAAMAEPTAATRAAAHAAEPATAVISDPPRPALTEATMTTAGVRRLRWAALVFPLLAAGVLAVVFYFATRVEKSPKPAASARTSAARSAAASGSASASGSAKPPSPPPPAPPPAEPAVPPPAAVNCFLTNDCQETCDGECELPCTRRSGCTIGAVHDANVRCTGPDRCEVSCAGNCKVRCDRGAACLLHCAPGFECKINDCPVRVEECSQFVYACSSPCPG